MDNTSLRKRRKTLRNIRNLKPGLGTKNPTQTRKSLRRGGKRGGGKKSYGRVGQKEMELREGDWVIGNLTSVYENIPLIFIAQS